MQWVPVLSAERWAEQPIILIIAVKITLVAITLLSPNSIKRARFLNTLQGFFSKVDFQCHRRILLTFCLCLSYFGVRTVISRYTHLIHLIGHIRPFCILATRLVLEQENVVVTFIVGPHFLDKTRAEVSRQFFSEPESSKALQRIR